MNTIEGFGKGEKGMPMTLGMSTGNTGVSGVDGGVM